MNYSEPQDPLPVAILIALVIIMFCLLMGKAFADCYTPSCMHESSIRPRAEQVKIEPVVVVERYNEDDFRGDKSVLISGAVRKIKVSTPSTAVGVVATTPSEPIVTTEFIEDRIDLSMLSDELAVKVRRELE